MNDISISKKENNCYRCAFSHCGKCASNTYKDKPCDGCCLCKEMSQYVLELLYLAEKGEYIETVDC